MSSLVPLSTYNLALKPFNPVPAIEDEFPVTIRLTLAAVDPEAADDKKEPSTLRILKRTNPFFDDGDFDEDMSDSEAEESDELDSEESEEEEEKPKKSSKKEKSKKEEENSDEENADEDEGSSDEDIEDDEDVSEFVVCTLSPQVQFQQALDITITPDEEVYFVATGSYPIHLTGNYVEHPANDEEDEYDEEYSDDDEYNLTPDEDEVVEGDDYDLDDLEEASDVENRIEELVAEDEEKEAKKRASEEKDDQSGSKKKKAKKDKSVQFSKELEQGPTGPAADALKEKSDKKGKKEKKEKKENKESTEDESKAENGSKKYPVKTLEGGVVTEDRKIGTGKAAKKGNKVGIRYIGKLKNGKIFDKNTSGKPFVFALGKGECIKGFDLGVAGMAVGGERRVIIPPKMGYGNQALPGLPANSELTFDIKLVSIK